MATPNRPSSCGRPMGAVLQGAVLAVAAFALLGRPGVHGGKVLVFPVDGSHWVNMELIVRHLHARGHEVTVVRSASSWYVKEKAPHYRSVTVALPESIQTEDEDFFVHFLSKMLEIRRGGASVLSFISFYREMLHTLSTIHRQSSRLVAEMFENRALMEELSQAGFHLVLMDPGLPSGVLVAHRLKLPVVYNVRWITSGEGHAVVAPSPVSYVPASFHAVSDRMTFGQRVANVLQYALHRLIDRLLVMPHYDRLVDAYFDSQVDFYYLLQTADMWLMRVDFVLEFPRPTMPNVAYIGGFQCRPAEPLPSELEDFVSGSGDHGFVLMSLGTLVKGLPLDITSQIAAAFARLPQRVVWRHGGEPPRNLGNNTLLVKWLPQNDLLGHPKVKAFVSHCGINGVYEALYHAVPVLGLPLLFDQLENAVRLEVRGAAKVLDVSRVTEDTFLEALRDVLHDPSYRANVERLSGLHRDKPAHPLDTALYWIEFVMRHGGAAHLRTESYAMPWYSYHCLDVLAFILAVLLLLMAVVVVTVRCLCSRLCRRRKAKQE